METFSNRLKEEYEKLCEQKRVLFTDFVQVSKTYDALLKSRDADDEDILEFIRRQIAQLRDEITAINAKIENLAKFR